MLGETEVRSSFSVSTVLIALLAGVVLGSIITLRKGRRTRRS